MNKNVSTFIGCDSGYKDAEIVVFGAPFDSTSSFRPGSRFAPGAMRAESSGIETYSPYQDRDLSEIRVFDGGDLELPFGSAEKALRQTEKFTARIIKDKKTPCMLGGEHLLSLGAVRAAQKVYPDLCVLHFDAHADLRDQYLGEALSHATVMRRVWDVLGDGRIFQFGVRSGEKAEFQWARDHVFLHKYDLNGLPDAAKLLSGKPVYFSLDLDVLDPSALPGTGTPEAGGVSFPELLHAVGVVSSLNVVGFDICELSPEYDRSGASTALACKLLRELLLAFHR